ncbi:LysR family transcriptional regulator [Mesorhizobium sp. CAU 1732]|uniref:LysR family transcriptional regulator n=1 Tax=Mesorhizobium sp. CAU 1732 TaxID=3140358 RepID=UPI0032606F9A
MRQVNLRAVDLNLLTVLDALLEECSVTRAAVRLGMSQPAVSRALARLRSLFDDALLVDGPGGYLLSERAEQIVPVLRRALAGIGNMLDAPAFDPATATGRLRLSTPDLYAAVIGPPLLAHIGREAPGLNLDIVAPGPAIIGDLEEGTLEAVIGVIDDAPAGIQRRGLFDDGYVTLLRAGHPAADDALTLGRFLELDHIAISVTGVGSTPVDDVLAMTRHKRRVKVTVPNFLAAVEIAAQSDLVMTLPESLARMAAGVNRFVMRTPPADPGRFTLSMLWHARHQASPRHVWLRDAIVHAAAQVERKVPSGD